MNALIERSTFFSVVGEKMNEVGRHRSGSSTARHQRHYSDHFLETSTGLQHLQSSNIVVPPVQDFGNYNGQSSRMYRSVRAERTYRGGGDLFVESLMPLGKSWRKKR